MRDHIVRPAPAKVNLALHVTGRRPDGYHEIESLVCFARIADRIEIAPARADDLRVEGRFAPGVPADNTNIVARALEKFRKRWPGRLPDGLDIRLTKNLPHAAGIGGGSADAAATLLALAEIAGLGDPRGQLAPLALELGADVPVCLAGTSALMSGIGETVKPVALPDFAMVLANPLVEVGTAEVFERLIPHRNPGLPAPLSAFHDLSALVDWLEATRNDLAGAAESIAPGIAAMRSDMARSAGCGLARMSGSGATVFGLFAARKDAERAAAGLERNWPGAWVVATSAQ